jgi:hypothetical protein
MRLWDVEAGECRNILIGHTEAVRIVVYSSQGGQVASGGNDGSLKLWDDATGECLHTLAGHTKGVTSVVFSSSGDQVVSGSEDKTVRLWNATSGQCQAAVQDLGSGIRGIAWSTTLDTNNFFIGCEDGAVFMWQVIEDGGMSRVRVRWSWRPVHGGLDVVDTLIQDVHGSSQLDMQLLKQRGAMGEPFVRLREASKKVMSMASVISTLQQSSTGLTEISFANDLVGEQPQPEQSEDPVE